MTSTNYFAEPKIGISLENFHYKSKGKFFLPSITPTLSSSVSYNTSTPSPSESNIVNKPALPIKSITQSNYIELYVPEYMTDVTRTADSNIIAKGAKVIITFTDGDMSRPRITGPY